MARSKEKQASALTLAAGPHRRNQAHSGPFSTDSTGNSAGSLPAGLPEASAAALPGPAEAASQRLGTPLNIRQAAALIGCSPWTVRQTLIPKGLPYFRSGASGRLIFYENQLIRWIETKQQKGGKLR